MTYETFEKARELYSEMEYLSELESLISNAGHERNLLAAINDVTYADAFNICIDNCHVLNHSYLTENMKEKFIKVIREEHDRLYEEFQSL